MESDFSRLQEELPGWNFGTVWVSAGTGPDARRLWAQRNTVLVTAWTPAELREKIRHEESQ